LADFDATQSLQSLDSNAIAEFPTDNGPADYALFLDGQVAGVVEAKKVTVGPQNDLTQAARYSQGVREHRTEYGEGFKAPFLYSTNGEPHSSTRPTVRSSGFRMYETRSTALARSKLSILPPHFGIC